MIFQASDGCGPHRRGIALVSVCALLLAVLAGSPARAASVSVLQQELNDLERQAQNLRIKYQAREISQSRAAEQRLVDAQVLYSLKDYTRAAILLLDYVNKYKDTSGYPEALFFLADSLYHKRDFISAKRYFTTIVREVRGNRYQDALQRLVELSMLTDETAGIQEYLDALSAIPVSQLKPSVPYVRAKYYYFQNLTDQAITALRVIPQGHEYYQHAQYFLGACMVRKKNLAGAAKVFEGLLRQYPKTDAQKHIKDLAHLALGRLLYERDKVADAIKMYQRVPRQSPEFDTALYEVAWAYVKQKAYSKANRALELLVLANPDSPFIPEVKVLQGNLLIREKKWGSASALFTSTRERFFPVYQRMKQVMDEHRDPNLFFDLLLKRSTSTMGIVISVPKLAVHWVKERDGIKRALNLVSDVRDIKGSIKEAKELIRKLEKALNSPAKIRIFPEFAASKASALEVENRLELARARTLEGERRIGITVASGSERDKLHQLAGQRAKLEVQIKNLPKTAVGYEDRQKIELTKIQEMEKQINKMSIIVESLKAQLVAAEKYAADTAGKRKPAAMASFRKEAAQVRGVVEGLQQEVGDLNQELSDAKTMAGVGGTAEVSERKLKSRFRKLVAEEHALLQQLRGKLSGDAGQEFDGYARLMDRCIKLDTFLGGYDGKLEKQLEDKLQGVRATLEEEKRNVAYYTLELQRQTSKTDTVAGNLTYTSFRDVAQKFYEIVVRSDVGIIDVAWALKDSKSKEVSSLVRQRKQDLKLLDDEFKEVLREE